VRKLAPEEMSKGLREMMPLFKFGEKRDIAMAALYLASDAGWFCCSTCFLTRLLLVRYSQNFNKNCALCTTYPKPEGHIIDLVYRANRIR